MRYAILKGSRVDNVIEAASEIIARVCERSGCDGYMLAAIEDPGLRALGPGATVQGVEAARVPDSIEIDRSKITGITPPPADA
jgi:hypothetical protein